MGGSEDGRGTRGFLNHARCPPATSVTRASARERLKKGLELRLTGRLQNWGLDEDRLRGAGGYFWLLSSARVSVYERPLHTP